MDCDLVKNHFAMIDGTIRPNSGPGIGVDLDAEYLGRSTVNSWKLL
jgi:L-alanine-DL-glutamate epimerase-like enolase superfamily enzyme